jgi:ribosomal protein S18 acetylase RimI-like enzyme
LPSESGPFPTARRQEFLKALGLADPGQPVRSRLVEDAQKIRLGDLNFIESLREQTRAAGGEVVERDGLVLMKGSHPHPLHNNVVRVDPSRNASRCLELAREYYGLSGYGFIIALLNGDRGDGADEFGRECQVAGLIPLVAPPAMFVESALAPPEPPSGCVLRLLDATGIDDFMAVSCAAWGTYAIPTEAVTSIFADARMIGAPNVRVVVGYRDGRPQATALCLLSHGIGGVYWVGTVPSARGAGLGEACTAMVTNLAFEAGARLVTLQASPMGEPIYRRMGYEPLGAYKLFVHAGGEQ